MKKKNFTDVQTEEKTAAGPEDLNENEPADENRKETDEEMNGNPDGDFEETCSGDSETAAQENEEAQPDAEKAEDEKEKKISELEDRFRRLFAEFDNYRKRTENEKSGMFFEGEKAVLLKMLDIADNFERALASVPDDKEAEAFAEGVKMIYKQLMKILEGFGVTPIEAAGKPFDANLHNAVMHVEDEELPENTVAEEFQKGYMISDKVLRYSMVKVAN